MANEVYVSAQGDTLVTSVLAKRLEMLLHQSPFMRRLAAYRGDTRGSGSAAVKVAQVDDDDIAESGIAEGSGVAANTAISDSSYSLTPGRIAIKRVLSNRLAGIDSTGLMNERALAGYNFGAIMRGFDALFCTQLASLTGTAGTSGADATMDDWFVAKQALVSRNVTGKLAWVGAQKQFNDLQSDMRGEVGPWQLNTQVQAVVASSSGENFKGTLDGIELWTSAQIADANGGADHGGGMLQIPGDSQPNADGKYEGDAAISYAEGSPAPSLVPGMFTEQDGVVYTTITHDADKGEVLLVTNYMVSAGVAEAGKGIKFVTNHA